MRTNGAGPIRRPFWLPAANYYFLAAAVALAVFFVLWGVFHDLAHEMPWIVAGLSGSVVLIAAVIVRELVLRRARMRYVAMQKNFDRNIADAYSRIDRSRVADKLSIEKNATLLREIKRRSDAANVLRKFAAGHREVFEMCAEYVALVDREFGRMGSGSPRFAALRKGRESALEFHRYHMLQWAAAETRTLSHEAQTKIEASERLAAIQGAIDVVESALGFYPDERSLIESREVLDEVLCSIKVSHWVEKAERAEFDGDLAAARNFYRDALFYLSHDGAASRDREIAAERINAAIEKLDLLGPK